MDTESADQPGNQGDDGESNGSGSSSAAVSTTEESDNRMRDVQPYDNWAVRHTEDPLPENVIQVMNQVFQNDMLVESILEKVILSKDRLGIRHCRLVSKQWTRAVSKLHRKMKVPLFVVNTSRDLYSHSDPPRPLFDHHTTLCEFLRPMTRPGRIEGFIPTFGLHLTPQYFRKSNYNDFVNCLVQCGTSLVELFITFPKNSQMSFLLPPRILLPNLIKMGVAFTGQTLQNSLYAPGAFLHQHEYFPNFGSIHLVQTILNSAPNLKSFSLMRTPSPINPPDLENLYLPDNLFSLRIETPLKGFDLILRKQFTNLTELTLNATMALYSEAEIFELLSKLSSTLRVVALTGIGGGLHRPTLSLPVKLPRMECLSKFVMFKPWEFEERNPPLSFDEIFPKMETLVFGTQTEGSFSYLMSGMRSSTVTSFTVWLTSTGTAGLPRMGGPPAHQAAPFAMGNPPRQIQLGHPMLMIVPEVNYQLGRDRDGNPNPRHHLIRIRRQMERNQDDNNLPAADNIRNPANEAQPRVGAEGNRQPNRQDDLNPNDPHMMRMRRIANDVQRRRAWLQRQYRLRIRNMQMVPRGAAAAGLRQGDPVIVERERDRDRDMTAQIRRRLQQLRERLLEQQELRANRIPERAGVQRGVNVERDIPRPPRIAAPNHNEAPVEIIDISDSSDSDDADEIEEMLRDMMPPMLHVQNENEAQAIAHAQAQAQGRQLQPLQVLAAAAMVDRNQERVQENQAIPNPGNGNVAHENNRDPNPPNADNNAPAQRGPPAGNQEIGNNQDAPNPIARHLHLLGEMDNRDAFLVMGDPPGDGNRMNGERRANGGGGGERNLRVEIDQFFPFQPVPPPAHMQPHGILNQQNRVARLAIHHQNMMFEYHRRLAGQRQPPILPDRPVTMTKEKMQQINVAFINLTKLKINICGPEVCGLKYIFEEMTGLQVLKIVVEKSLWPIKWDSLLTGIPGEFCEAIKPSTELWDEVYLNENQASIRRLTKLEELAIVECSKFEPRQDRSGSGDEDRLISDVAFHFALLKMKNLRLLTVTNGFNPSLSMTEKWYKEKGYPIKVVSAKRMDQEYEDY